jgi:membrane-bound lytic murein transglycosylase D
MIFSFAILAVAASLDVPLPPPPKGMTRIDLPMPPPPKGLRKIEPVPMPPPPRGLRAIDVPLPPPPKGMVLLSQASTTRLAQDEDPADTELEEMRALEEAALDPLSQPEAALRSTVAQLGHGSALRDRLTGWLDEAREQGEEIPFTLAPVTRVIEFDADKVRDRYDIPVEMRPLVAQYVRFFQSSGRRWFRRWMSRSARWLPVMQPILESKGLPRDLVYLAMIESGFNTEAKSWAAAVGPWQFIAETGTRMGLRNDFWVDERRDPIKSTYAAARYLSFLYKDSGHWYLAWAGYNTGENRVRRMVERYQTKDFWELCEKKGFAKETKHYVPKLIAAALVAKHPEAFGFSMDEFDFETPFLFDTVAINESIDIEVAARAAGTTADELHRLNPGMKRWLTPPATEQQPWELRVPQGAGEKFAANLESFGAREKLKFEVHKVKKGDTLSGIARKYGSIPEVVLRMNNLKNVRALRLGAELLVPIPSARAVAAGKADPAMERQAARARSSGLKVRPDEEVPAGTASTRSLASGTVKSETIDGKTRVTYGVANGDTLWSIAQRFDCTVGALRGWNSGVPQRRNGLKPGLALTIWPGPKAELTAPTVSKVD